MSIDNDGDGLFDEDPIDGVNEDFDCKKITDDSPVPFLTHMRGNSTDGEADDCFDGKGIILKDLMEIIDEEGTEAKCYQRRTKTHRLAHKGPGIRRLDTEGFPPKSVFCHKPE